MGRPVGSRNRTAQERAADAYAAFLKAQAEVEAEEHPFIPAFQSLVGNLEAAISQTEHLPEPLLELANTARAALSTIRTVARSSDIGPVRVLIGGEAPE